MKRYYDIKEAEKDFVEIVEKRKEYLMNTSDIDIRPLYDEKDLPFWIIGTPIQAVLIVNEIKNLKLDNENMQQIAIENENIFKKNEKIVTEKLEKMKNSVTRKFLLKLHLISNKKVEKLEELLKNEHFIKDISIDKINRIRYETPEHEESDFEKEYGIELYSN